MECSNSNNVGSMSAAGSARIQIGNNSTINNTTNNISQDNDEKYLAALCSTDPRHDKIRIGETNGGLLKGSYGWVLQSPEYRRWRHPDESWPLLWIRGDPGKGKTMLLSGIIDELEPSTRLKSPTSDLSLSYFFCQATNSGLNSAAEVLRGLVYLLVDQNRCLVSHLRDKPSLTPEHWNSRVAIRDVLFKILKDPSLQSIILVVDALDECLTDLEFLLEVVISTSSPQVRWLVSSRNIPDIQRHLEQAQTKVALSLELNKDLVSQAVDYYIHHRVHQLGISRQLSTEDLMFAKTYLSQNARGTFLWVSLVCQRLSQSKRWEVKKFLRDFPSGLNHLYERMMGTISHKSSKDLYRRILAIVSTVHRPITFSELRAIEDLSVDEDTILEMVMECGCFLTCRYQTIYFVHQSAKDFLALQQNMLFPSGLTQHHLGLFDACLNSLDVLEMDMYEQVYPGVGVNEAISNCPEPDPLSGLSYSCEFWAHHLRDAQPIHAQDIFHYKKAHHFIAAKFLFWLEALTLLSSLPAAMDTLQILKDLPLADDAVALVEDAWRFLLYFQPVIEWYPLQIYASGLIFSPEESLIRRHFEDFGPKFVTKRPRVDAQWRPYMSTDDEYCSLIFSTDNNSLVTSRGDSLTKWNVIDGMEIMSARYDGLGFMIPSPDLNWVAGVATYRQSPDDVEIHALQVRSLASNTIKWTRDIDDRQVCSMKFSPDSQWLAVCSHEELVLWGFEKSNWKRWPLGVSLEKHDQQIEFSSDGALVAISGYSSVPSSGGFVVLDARTGKQHKNPIANFQRAHSMVFTPNTHEIMICCRTGIWSWDVVGGECQQWLGSCDSYHIAYSHDASCIAVASSSTVFLYGKQNRELLQRFETPAENSIPSIAPSFDGQQLAVHADGTVWLCDITSSMSKQTRIGRVSVKKIFVSDNRCLMAWALETKIQVLDATTGIHLCEFDMPWFWGAELEPRSAASLAVFSSNGHMLAASSSSGSFSLLFVWDLSGQKLLLETEVPDSIFQLAISHDENNGGRWAAAITAQNIYVWDVTTMRLRWSLEHTSEYTRREGPAALQFCDGKLVILWSQGMHHSLIYYNATNGTRLTQVKLPSVEECDFPNETFSLSPSGQRATWGSEIASELQVIFLSQEQANIQMVLRSTVDFYQPYLTFPNDSTVLTNYGMLNINTTLAEAAIEPNTPQNTLQKKGTFYPAFIGYGCSYSREWITLDGHGLLWLPPHYRPFYDVTGLASGPQHFATNSFSGVYFMQFSENGRDLLRYV